MRLEEFERRFGELWEERYSLCRSEYPHWSLQRANVRAMRKWLAILTEYARSAQEVGVSRCGKNKAQRLFDELGVSPSDVDFPGANVSDPLVMPCADAKPVRGRILYVERKAGKLMGEARIGRVTESKSGRTLLYGGRNFRSLKGSGFKANYFCVETGEQYWISGCRRDGCDRLYGERLPIHIDEDVREEYWTGIRRMPEHRQQAVIWG